ncbi:hypothetical protein [Nitrosomonas sp. Nm34]|uniref:hypothetical protein n=1 Tax=Nitrosomonas sp. Nm34 TaxID=1881055 RepID=UPI0011137D44|nr:hypothetical protein [Nitrosomonas sp. Nm34]
MRLIHNGSRRDTAKPTRGGRRHENLSREEEVAFLAPFIEKAAAGGILMVNWIHLFCLRLIAIACRYFWMK